MLKLLGKADPGDADCFNVRVEGLRIVTAYVRFWPRLEMSRSFVLSELGRILFVRQNRLGMRLWGSKASRS